MNTLVTYWLPRFLMSSSSSGLWDGDFTESDDTAFAGNHGNRFCCFRNTSELPGESTDIFTRIDDNDKGDTLSISLFVSFS